jgi:thymidine kinase
MSGHLTVIIGSMFSGKSTEIIRLINRFKVLNKTIVAINHSLDDRYDGDNAKIITHDKVKMDCLKLEKLLPFSETEKYKKSEVIVIEEGQFFSDLFDFVVKSVDIEGKRVIVAGLDGDYLRRPFGDMLKIIPYAEEVKKLEALCLKCNDGTTAYFTKRIGVSDKRDLVGSNDQYIAVCRKHYLDLDS